MSASPDFQREFDCIEPGLNRYRRTRLDHSSETATDYVKAIWIIRKHRIECRLIDLARYFHVSHVTVNRILARLEREFLVTTVRYGPVSLTQEGELLAKESLAKHQIVLSFLVAIGVQPETAEADAEGIEHHVSRQTLECMQRSIHNRRVA